MPLTTDELAILAAKRTGLPPSSFLRLATMIPAALTNLAWNVAKDPNKRNLLMTDPEAVTATIAQSSVSDRYYADLATVLTTNQAMLETFKWGTIWHTYATKTFPNTAVSGTIVTLNDHGFQTGTKVQFRNVTAIVLPLLPNTNYWLIRYTPNTFGIAATYADALADNAITLTDGSAGTVTVIPAWTELQWVSSPTIGQLPTCMSVQYVTGYLVNDHIYVQNATSGILRFAVPFTPSLATLPDDEDLQNLLLDEMVALVLTADPAPPQQALTD